MTDLGIGSLGIGNSPEGRPPPRLSVRNPVNFLRMERRLRLHGVIMPVTIPLIDPKRDLLVGVGAQTLRDCRAFLDRIERFPIRAVE